MWRYTLVLDVFPFTFSSLSFRTDPLPKLGGPFMNKMHRKVEYSLMALKHMSVKRQGELTSAKEIAESYHAPFEAVARALQMMAQKGLLKSEQGAQGGYQISRNLKDVNLLELIEMMEGPTRIAKCMNSGETCEIGSHCNIVEPLQNLNTRLSEFYSSVSIDELLVQNRGARHE